jgi:hypothetical protein
MNYKLDDIQLELSRISAELDLATEFFIETLNTFNNRLERAELWIEDLKKRMLN